MTKITLSNVGSLIDATTAQSTINANNAVIQTAFDNTLSRDGTAPNQMGTTLDMNSSQIINLPAPATANSPLRLQDLTSFVGGGTVSNIPTGGTTGQVLSKSSNTDYVTGWTNSVTSVGLALPADLTVTNSPVTTTGTLTGAWATTPTGTGAMVRATSPTLVTPALGTPASGVATNLTGTAAGLTAGNVTTNANLTGPITSTGNATSVASQTGTGSTFVMNTSPTLVSPSLGVASATTLNGITIQPSSGTLALNTNTLGVPGSGVTLQLQGTGTTTQTFPTTSGTVVSSATTAGGSLVGTYPSPTIASNAVTNAMHATMPANTFKGNVTGSAAVPTDFTIDGLTLKASPAAGDEVVIWDVAGTAIKKTTVSSLASAGSVSSIAGNTGAFTLGDGLTNSTNVLLLDFSDLQGFISGLVLSTAGASSIFAISPGMATDIAGGGMLKITSGSFTKTTAAWAVGSGNGSFDGTGAAPSATAGWYHVYVIKRTDTGVVDILTSLSATAPTLPASYTLFRRIGSMKTDGSFHWIAFTQNGNEFLWSTPLWDINTTTLGTTAVLYTLTVPPGVKVNALLSGFVNNAAVGQTVVSSPDVPDNVPTSGSNFQVPSAGGYGTSSVSIRTNTSQQVRARAGAASTTLYLYTFGWIENL